MSLESIIGEALVQAMTARPRRPFVLGLCGPQGSGKSTIAAVLAARFANAAVLSLDDLYETRAERLAMARDVHPLFATRGAPGTHDVALGLATLAALDRGEPAPLPRFDKAIDDRIDPSLWPTAPARCELLVFEGWCVGARPEDPERLALPVNALERDEDANGVWRSYANQALVDYQPLFGRIDLLALLEPPSFDTVVGWRQQQEDALRATRGAAPGIMDQAQVARFVAHYERLTRHILSEMPRRADLRLRLSAQRQHLRDDEG